MEQILACARAIHSVKLQAMQGVLIPMTFKMEREMGQPVKHPLEVIPSNRARESFSPIRQHPLILNRAREQ
jgi:hypothetical protein